MKLSQYAKELGICYKTAWIYFKAGRIPGAYKNDSGTVIVPNKTEDITKLTAVYARVSSSENKNNLISQSKRVQEFCGAKGWEVAVVVEECASGLNDERKKLMKLLTDDRIGRIVVEHKDRLTRFGFNYIKMLWSGELVVINVVTEDKHDLMQDFVSLVTSFTARLYGRRRTKRMTEKLIKGLKNNE
jgi:predicted site-specific integrase-resolvase